MMELIDELDLSNAVYSSCVILLLFQLKIIIWSLIFFFFEIFNLKYLLSEALTNTSGGMPCGQPLNVVKWFLQLVVDYNNSIITQILIITKVIGLFKIGMYDQHISTFTRDVPCINIYFF